MKIALLPHARWRMRERGLEVKDVRLAILHPDKLEFDRTNHHRLLAKKVYRRSKTGARLLLMVIYEVTGNIIEVITVISTSKVNKYL